MGKLRKSRNSTPTASLSKAAGSKSNPNQNASPMSLRTQAPTPSSPGASSLFDDNASIRSGKSATGAVGLGTPQSASVRSMRSISSASLSLDTVSALPILSTISTSPSSTPTSNPLDALSTPTKSTYNSKSPPTSLPSTPPSQVSSSEPTIVPKSSSSALATLRQRLENDEVAREKERIAALNSNGAGTGSGAGKLRKRRPTGEGMNGRPRREGSLMSYETADPDLDQEIEIDVNGGELEHEILPGQEEGLEQKGGEAGIWKGSLVFLPARISYAVAKKAVNTTLVVGSHIPVVSSILPLPTPTFTSSKTTSQKSHMTSPSTSTASSSTLHPAPSTSTSTTLPTDSPLSPTSNLANEKTSSLAYKALEVGLTASLATALVAGAGVNIGWSWVRGKKAVVGSEEDEEADLDNDLGKGVDGDEGGVGKGKGKFVVH